MNPTHPDVIIIGGGIIGSATAYSLMQADNRLRVVVVERDPSYARASTTLSMANVRIQFSLKQNIQISQYAFDVLKTFEDSMAVEDKRPHIAYRPEGNLFLIDETSEASAKNSFELQKKMGCSIEWWSADKIQQQYPLYKTAGFVGGSFGARDGHFDAYALLMGYKVKASSMGVHFLADEVVEINVSADRCQGVQLASGDKLKAGAVINCAGAWASDVARTAGIQLPVDPVKRQVYVLSPAIRPVSTSPMPPLAMPGLPVEFT